MKALFFTAIIHLLACAPSVWAGDTCSHETILVQALIANAAGDCTVAGWRQRTGA